MPPFSLLLSHAKDGEALEGATLHGSPLSRDAALHLALDVAHKATWRYAVSQRGLSAKRTTFVRILLTALQVEMDSWRDLANDLMRFNETQLVCALGGEMAGHPTPGTRALALFSLFVYQAAKAAATAQADHARVTIADASAACGRAESIGPTADDEWLCSESLEMGCILPELLGATWLEEGDARRLAVLLQRAQAVAALQVAQTSAQTIAALQPEPMTGARPRICEDWVDVGRDVSDAMQQD